MASDSVVVLEPGRKGGGSLAVGGKCLPVCPLGGQGAVVSLHFAVLPWTVGLDELLRDPERGTGLAHRVRVAVGESVVGQDPFDRDAVLGEERRGTLEKRRAPRPFLVGQDLAVSNAGVVV